MPINGPIARPPPAFEQAADYPSYSSVSSSSSLSSTARPSQPSPAAPKKPKNPFSRQQQQHSKEDGPVGAAAAHVRLLEEELETMRTRNTLLSERMDKGISLMSRLLVDATPESPPDLERVRLALAAIKQVRDILRGELAFDDMVLHVNESAFVAAEDDGTNTDVNSPALSGVASGESDASGMGMMTERARAEMEQLERENEEQARADAERNRIRLEEQAAQEAKEAEEEEKRREEEARVAAELKAEREKRANQLKEELFADEPGQTASLKFLANVGEKVKAPQGNIFADDDEDDEDGMDSFSSMSLAQRNATTSAKLESLFS